MPHVTIEYSANLEAEVEPMTLVNAVHRAVLSQPVFEAVGVRTRAARREHFLVADGDPSHAFIAVTARIGPGRTLAERKAASEAIMTALHRRWRRSTRAEACCSPSKSPSSTAPR